MPRPRKKQAVGLREESIFYFYSEVGCYADRQACNLEEFAAVITDIPVQSVEFHVRRGDFAAWLTSQGQKGLAAQVNRLDKENLAGEELRKALLDLVNKKLQSGRPRAKPKPKP